MSARSRTAGRWSLMAAAAVAAAVLLLSHGSDSHVLRMIVPEAANNIVGQDVRAAGQKIGRIAAIEPVRGGRAAVVKLEISDDRAWPLPRGTKFALRWGGTISFSNRYVAVHVGAPGPPLADGATVPAADVSYPVEFDAFAGTFDQTTRRSLKLMLDRGGATLLAARPALRRTLDTASPAITQTGAVMADVADDEQALSTLVRSTSGVVGSVRHADPGLRTLISAAATTFDTAAGAAAAIKQTIADAPPTLAGVRDTLRRTDVTLRRAVSLTDDLGPGVAELRRIASPLSATLQAVTNVGPNLRDTLATARRHAGAVAQLLAHAGPVLPQVRSAAEQATTALRCIRPYTPEIVGFFTDWGAWLDADDGTDRIVRANVQAHPAPYNAMTLTPAQLVTLRPGTTYAFPAPPGYVAGQPWLLPECGAGADALDPSKDPEVRSAP